MVDLMRIQWNRVLKELYDWHTLINSETLKYLTQSVQPV